MSWCVRMPGSVTTSDWEGRTRYGSYPSATRANRRLVAPASMLPRGRVHYPSTSLRDARDARSDTMPWALDEFFEMLEEEFAVDIPDIDRDQLGTPGDVIDWLV